MEPAGGGVQVVALGKRYGHTTALKGVSFTLALGEMLAVVGPDGAGKTALVLRDERWVEIISGLSEGELVATSGLTDLVDGEHVLARVVTNPVGLAR